MKEIKLTQGKVALVDDEDFKYLNQWKWFANKLRNTYYAIRNDKNRKSATVYMHREILITPELLEIDHRDRNGLNNQKFNLRICTRRQNAFNNKPVDSISEFIGVSYIKGKYIRAYIRHENKQIHLGLFKSEYEAAKAYDMAAKKYRGEFANLNFK